MLFLLCVQWSIGQEAAITGTISDESGAPVSFATTYLETSEDNTLIKAVISDADGKFTFKNISEGEYVVKVTSVGFEDYRSQPFLYSGGALELFPVTLISKAETLEEVNIIAEKPIVEVKADKTVFNVDKTINAIGSTGFELLRKAPGVIIDNNNSIIVEGKAGVQIYIDGRPSVLRGQDLINFLETLQSTDIDAIEIITQPSSKYEAAGNAGIINIKLKKDKSLGTNGSITTGFNQGTFGRVNTSLNLNNRGKKTNIYGTYSNRFGDSFGFINLLRNQNDIIFDARTTSRNDNNNHNLKAGFDYYLNDKNTFGIILTGNFNNAIGRSDSQTPVIPGGQTEPLEVLLAQSVTDNVSANYNGNFNYKFADTLGHELNVDLDYGRYTSDRDNFQPNYYVDGTQTDTLRSSITRFITPIDIDILAAQTDYEQNLLKGKLGLGGRISYVRTENTFNLFDVLGGLDIFNPEQSNTFNYTEQINAGYLNYNIRWKKFNLQVGLRVEQTISEGELISTQDNDNQLVKRNYTDYFPSGGLTYQVNQKNSLALTYSRRIQRPSYQSLNPFQYRIDELSFRQGNPFLQPQYTNNIRIAHTYNYRLTTSFTYSYISDFFAQVTEAADNNQNFIITRNVANQRVYNVGVSYPTKFADWWNIYFSLNAFRSEYEATSEEFVPVEQNTLSLYAQNTFNLPKDFRLEISGWYSSPSVWGGTYRTKSLGSLNLAVQKKFMNDNITARIALNDLLFTSPWRGDTTFGDLTINGSGGYDSRQLRFSVNYVFGSNEIKQARKRKTGIEDEQGRIQDN